MRYLRSDLPGLIALGAMVFCFAVIATAAQERAHGGTPAATAGRVVGTIRGYSIPGIERVDVSPTETQVRFFHADDRSRVEDLAKRLDEANIKNAQVQMIAG